MQTTSIITSQEAKKKAVHLLVEKGFLTEEEYRKCIRAIMPSVGATNTRKMKVLESGDVILEDSTIQVSLLNISQGSNFFSGNGVGLQIQIDNISNNLTISSVHFEETLVNGFTISVSSIVPDGIPANGKTVGNLNYFYQNLKPIGVQKPEDIKSIAFRIKYFYKDERGTLNVRTTLPVSFDTVDIMKKVK